jgi:hypothetical protein
MRVAADLKVLISHSGVRASCEQCRRGLSGLHHDLNPALNILQKGGGTAFGEALPLGGPQNPEAGRL